MSETARAVVAERPVSSEPVKPPAFTTPEGDHIEAASKIAHYSGQAGAPTTTEKVLPHGEGTAVLTKLQNQHSAELIGEFVHDARRFGEQLYSGSHYINEAKPGRVKLVWERARKKAAAFNKPQVVQNFLSLFRKQKV